MIDSTYALAAIVGMAAVTVLLRALPFLAAPLLKRYPIIERLGRFLPPAIMTLLLLHTVRGSAAENPAGVWQELLAISVTVVMQLIWRHALFSILVGTGVYVVLRNGWT